MLSVLSAQPGMTTRESVAADPVAVEAPERRQRAFRERAYERGADGHNIGVALGIALSSNLLHTCALSTLICCHPHNQANTPKWNKADVPAVT